MTGMRVLFVVNAFPSERDPQAGILMAEQMRSLERAGVMCGVYNINAGSSRWRYIEAVRRIRALVKDPGYDLVHAHYSFAAVPAVMQRLRPVVVSFMGSDVNGDYASRSIRLSRLLNGVVANAVGLCARRVIVKSRIMAGRLACGVDVVPNGVDLDFFRPMDRAGCRADLALPQAPFLVMFAGSPGNRAKDFPLARRAVDAAAAASGADMRLIHIHGKGREEYRKFLNAADMVLLTSFSEGSPNVVKEALACNLPVVSVDVGDAAEHLAGVRNAYVAPRTTEAVAEAVVRVFKSDRTSDGRERIGYLSSDTVATRLVRIYQECLV